MKINNYSFSEEKLIHDLKHFLPSQNPLNHFIHHNTLHSFQDLHFFEGIRKASKIFGYTTHLSINKFRKLYKIQEINNEIFDKILINKYGEKQFDEIKFNILNQSFDETIRPNIGRIRSFWNEKYGFYLEDIVTPKLFKILSTYLDQGISYWKFPINNDLSFIDNIRHFEKNNYLSIFNTKFVSQLLHNKNISITYLLKLLIGDNEKLYYHYIFDQQFIHPGWSGMVATIEGNSNSLIINKHITLKEVIILELLLELDTLNYKFGNNWQSLNSIINNKEIYNLFEVPEKNIYDDFILVFQEAYEWTFYNQIINGIQQNTNNLEEKEKTFQSLFCIDDRECSLRRYLEIIDKNCETFGTAGFFGIDSYFQPLNSNTKIQICPAPINPKHIIKEVDTNNEHNYKKSLFTIKSNSIFKHLFYTITYGIKSIYLFIRDVLFPSKSASIVSSLYHMHTNSILLIQNKNGNKTQDNLQEGYTIDEMVIRAENILKSIGLIKNFASIVYILGHGATSSNNPHYAAYDCGACSGRAGSVNSRALSYMLNLKEVRIKLKEKNIDIPQNSQFIGCLRDTSLDEIFFYDEHILTKENGLNHNNNQKVFKKALEYNAKERSRRFDLINTKNSSKHIHLEIIRRTNSIFEPRPELNHATNSICIIGRRQLSKNLFLDRRAFLNSYDYNCDLNGIYLLAILNAVVPVCGGINLEYYFSKIDNQKLGAGSKLSHNPVSLIGVSNGIEGDLRTGLPLQMVEVHNPLRLLLIIEHFPDFVLNIIKNNKNIYDWFINEWIILIVIEPNSKQSYQFKDGIFIPYKCVNFEFKTNTLIKLFKEFENNKNNISIMKLN